MSTSYREAHNCDFATVNRTHFRLMKSSPPKIPAQPVNVVPPVPPDMACSNNIRNTQLVTADDVPAIPTSQAHQKLSLYTNGHPPLLLKKRELVKSSQTVSQDRQVMLSDDNAQTPLNRISSSPSEYSTLPPYPVSANNSMYETPFLNTYQEPLCNMDSVYETPPEPGKPDNSFDK